MPQKRRVHLPPAPRRPSAHPSPSPCDADSSSPSDFQTIAGRCERGREAAAGADPRPPVPPLPWACCCGLPATDSEGRALPAAATAWSPAGAPPRRPQSARCAQERSGFSAAQMSSASASPLRSPTLRPHRMKKDETFLGKLGGTLARKKKAKEGERRGNAV